MCIDAASTVQHSSSVVYASRNCAVEAHVDTQSDSLHLMRPGPPRGREEHVAKHMI